MKEQSTSLLFFSNQKEKQTLSSAFFMAYRDEHLCGVIFIPEVSPPIKKAPLKKGPRKIKL